MELFRVTVKSGIILFTTSKDIEVTVRKPSDLERMLSTLVLRCEENTVRAEVEQFTKWNSPQPVSFPMTLCNTVVPVQSWTGTTVYIFFSLSGKKKRNI